MNPLHKLLPILALATCAQAQEWKFGAELSHAEVSGVRAYAAGNNRNINKTDSLLVPSIFATRAFGDKFQISARYSYYDEIATDGFSPDRDIFDELDFSPQQPTRYTIEEKIHEASTSLKYELWSNDRIAFLAGPTLTISRSNAEFHIEFSERPTKVSNTDFSLGAEFECSVELTDTVDAGFVYRFSNLPERDIHLFSVALGIKI